MKITVFYVGTSLLAPLKRAESEINRRYSLDTQVAAHNCGAPLTEGEWETVERDLAQSDLVFIIHVTESENAARILASLEKNGARLKAVIAFNCMPDLMRSTRMGKLDFARLMKSQTGDARTANSDKSLARKLGSWMADSIKGRGAKDKRRGPNTNFYLKLIGRLPRVLKLVPGRGRLGDIKNYLLLFCYFLQPTPRNISSMLLLAIKSYVDGHNEIEVEPLEIQPAEGIYHPDAPALFETFDQYRKWSESRGRPLERDKTVGLLLMRPQIVSDSRKHYDSLIRAIENEGLAVIPAISTFMDNRDGCRRFFVDDGLDEKKNGRSKKNIDASPKPDDRVKSRVSQIVSLTGFSFVGGPAMNDSQAAVEFLGSLNVPFRSIVSLDVQTIESWQQSRIGLNPIQTAMQVSIPEIDGATESLVFGGLPEGGNQPVAIEERCQRIARRLSRWNRLQTAARREVKLAFLVFCFPPNKGNIGTAADLNVFPSLLLILSKLRSEGYDVELPEGADKLRELVLGGNSFEYGTLANVAYRMSVDEYRRLCPHARDIENEWGRAPGTINSNGREILILGVQLGNVFVGVQPTFGYEGDPMRLLMEESSAPHHAYMAVYTYLEKVFCADAVVHVGTHGSTEFMPGKQVGLSKDCWPDRLIGDLPNIYIYSVNNPAEGTIAKRRSYAELVSYLTPPVENAGLYKGLAAMKDLITAYRKATGETEREHLYEAIEEMAAELNL